MYVMDIYFVKQPQNIIITVKMKEHEIGKKEYWKKSWIKHILLSLFCMWDRYMFSFIYIKKSCLVKRVWISYLPSSITTT